jgi:YesN/AraC family two-component response regulator
VLESQRVKEIARFLRSGEADWERETHKLLAALRSGTFSGEQVRHLLYMLLYHVQREMMNLPTCQQTPWLERSSRLEEELKKEETLSEISETILHVLDTAYKQFLEWRESKSHRVILQEVKRYINDHYNDPNLSLLLLGEKFELHPTLISRSFKEENGIKYVDYVNNVRIEQAIALIGNSDLTVAEVSAAVGFIHTQTFIKMFKRITGFTPGAYRKVGPGS